MSLPEFFYERVTSEIHQQMEGVLALAERLARQPMGADAQACVAGVAEAARAVRQILASSTDLKDAASAGLAFDPQARRAAELADNVQARWEERATDGGVTLLVSYDGDPDTLVMVDSGRINQIFDAFIAQALAGVRRGAVEATLKAVVDGDITRLEGRIRGAADRVMGDRALDIREIEALFGLETALGVALSRQIVDAMGGQVRSEANVGTGETLVFEVSVPTAYEEAPAEETLGQTERAAHILVVDDNATNRMVAETLCEMFDCTSESATDGVEAVEAARTGRFDLILMDIKMPRMDGVTATREIRALPGPAGQVPIIALTANADPEDAAAYLKAGMNGVVEKPMKPEHLLRTLQENLGGSSDAAAA
ncbi:MULTISPECIES: response regulator [unclassified Phenylobacterium]|uniref:response regulator n=1 Tax=unclassified Phenylobacterium TaxID=2640670 RepID=UPI00138F4D3A|nr:MULTISPECIES: response regulator [unclassified Phenylobacterium]